MTRDEMRDKMKELGEKKVKELSYTDFHDLFAIMNQTAAPMLCEQLCKFFSEEE